MPHLDSGGCCWGAEARVLGHGGIRLVTRAAGVREATVSLGVTELDAGAEPLGRVRRPALSATAGGARAPGCPLTLPATAKTNSAC